MSFIKDRGDVSSIAAVKRVMEHISFVSGFQAEYIAAPNKTLLKYGLHLTPEDLAVDESGDTPVPKNPNGALARYTAFMLAKLNWREEMRKSCAPDSAAFSKWRERQIGRCIATFSAARSAAMVHEVAAFELSSGCSIGCPFCGISAGKLQKVFRYTPENAALWNDVLAAATRVLGSCVGNATCYYGTEPLDNPDYETLIADYHAHFGHYPQLTTAAGCRNIERTRALIAALDPMDETIYRLSVRSKEEFDQIMRAFSPEELLLVELLPQYEGAPAANLIPVGRNVKDADDDEAYGDTIACVSGFLVNMCDKTIRLVTPVKASKRFPNGQVCLMQETFTDAASFEETLLAMIGKMKTILSPNEIVAMYPWLRCGQEGDVYTVRNAYDFHLDADKARSRDIFRRTCELLMEKTHTRREVVAQLKAEFPTLDTTALFYTVNILWNRGLIWDSQLFGEPGEPL